ncbi:hypothetical protein TBLA_0E04820 [Henningerozyma blattae CBS 6284]|uniref:Nascent polypeptide-associated complex subunit alpha n=1 Tax=Henningerozyma blattae (strain ATCC 34711 / CBS 6284 / DSM 70876 / NBRC 10599 / NRRL Y-10934 / UCD 77-7) TaxID=1071380 RepID=I2H582_HENB6|nr:hypothetical protein TBLA_0E04820 [Tetrapisispora blattae CBS 6284]CCH61534.1 hypothetical protein TBLA_0E04820 [Tetrapisispora blattae CBS 6284]
MSNVTVVNKNEKKAREMISKLNLKRVPGIARVTFRKKDNQIVAIENPEVYRSQGGNYVVFGEPKVDDFTQKLAAAQAQAEASGILPTTDAKDPKNIQLDMEAAAAADKKDASDAPAEVADDADAGDLSEEDIKLIMEQANVPRGKAIAALTEHKGDLVNAIMSLSK